MPRFTQRRRRRGPHDQFDHRPRPAISEQRLSLTEGGNIRYQLKTSYRDVTTHLIFESLDFMARLAALVPKPRMTLARYYGVFASIVFFIRHRLLCLGGYGLIAVIE